jgi:hypothetical protein
MLGVPLMPIMELAYENLVPSFSNVVWVFGYDCFFSLILASGSLFFSKWATTTRFVASLGIGEWGVVIGVLVIG